jgi:hypothetical protein
MVEQRKHKRFEVENNAIAQLRPGPVNLSRFNEMAWRFAAGTILTTTLILLAGCSTANYGNLKRSREVTLAFRSGQVFPDYRYYYRGWGSRPYAIVGIHRNYDLGPSSWKEIDLTATKLNEWIRRMELRYGYLPRGFLILDPTGKPVGVWYSSIEWAVVKMEEDNRKIVLSPQVRSMPDY